MKIRSVDIDSFRLFDDEKVSFVNPWRQENCANLVAIHAPNGFGKTSLFDAIEFCVTKNIQRLKTVTYKDDIKSDHAQNEYSSFIHNKDNPNKEIGIKIEFEDGTTQNRVVNPNEEIKLLKGEPENRYFSEVMLSQDWFSRFLSATDATQRFEMFTKNFKDTDGLLEYYEQLKTAHNILKKHLSNLRNEEKHERGKLEGNVDELITEHLSDTIKKLNAVGIIIDWNNTINEKQLEKLLLQGEQRVFETDEEQNRVHAIIDSIEKLIGGHEEFIPLDQLPTVFSKIIALEEQISSLQDRLKKIQALKTIISSIEKLHREKTKCEEANAEIEYLLKNYTSYKLIADGISEILRCREGKLKELSLLNNIIAARKKSLDAVLEQRNGLIKEIEVLKNKAERLKDEYSDYQGLLTRIVQFNDEEQKKRQQLTQISSKIEENNKELQRLSDMYEMVHQRTVSIDSYYYNEEVKKILAFTQKIKEKSILVDRLNSIIQEQQNYLGQVEALVVSAREMATTLRTETCPLCGQNYGKVENLLAAIEGNQTISRSIEDTINQRIKIEQETDNLKRECDDLYKQLADKIEERISLIKNTVKNQMGEKKETEDAIMMISQQRKIAQDRIRKDYSEFESLTENQVRTIYEKRQQEIDVKIHMVTEQETVLKEELNKKQNELNKLSQQIEVLDSDMLVKQRHPEYSDYHRKLMDRNENKPNVENWKLQSEKNKRMIAEYIEKINAAVIERDKLEKEEGILLTAELSLNEKIVNVTNEKDLSETQYFNTIQFIREDCKVHDIGNNTPPESIIQEVKRVRSLNTVKAESNENKSKLLAVFLNMLKSAEQYNGQQKIKKKIGDLEKQISRTEKRMVDVDKEAERLKDYLVEFVSSYFQLDLINKLYNTIDPHPNYKKVRFECDFNQKKPRLLVVMESIKDDNDKIVPNLYLSTAQINILSFCIFMAKAMFAKTDKGKDLDCIFVDDPIQALDDINILSMIDLLRNVAFTLNKQIVITTHDLNFFNLLQKKMPQDKFNACYLQLKERGKFKKGH